jgi:hypothetical protein
MAAQDAQVRFSIRSQAIRGDEGATILGPTNPAREAQSADRATPPRTDHGTLPNLKWCFADSHYRLEEGRWARQTTVPEIPIGHHNDWSQYAPESRCDQGDALAYGGSTSGGQREISFGVH